MTTWSISWALRNLIAELLMPPGIWIALILASLFFLKKYPRTKTVTIILASLMIWVCSTNYFANVFTNLSGHLLEWPTPFEMNSVALVKDEAQRKLHQTEQFANPHAINSSEYQHAAIVILGGGRRKGALELPEYQFQDVSPATMERLRTGARLAKLTHMPILVTGGTPDKTGNKDLSEAAVMQQVLEKEFNLKTQWVEGQSNTTEENARFSQILLKEFKIQKIYLVTHFWHMPRAKAIFEKELGKELGNQSGKEIEVIPVPTSFYLKEQFTPLDFYPSNEGFQRTRYIWHELIGNLWYRLKL